MGRKTQIKCNGAEGRFEEIAEFVYERFGNSIKYIADVAGGQGMLTRILKIRINEELAIKILKECLATQQPYVWGQP